MKKFLLIAVLAFMSTTASAAWCNAASVNGWGQVIGTGWATSPRYSIDGACLIALSNCAANTPVGFTCYVTSSGY